MVAPKMTRLSSTLVVAVCFSAALWILDHVDAAGADPSAMLYLSQFGYLSVNRKNGSEALVDIRPAVEDFQNFAGLNITGVLDEETIKMMSLDRCGVKDIVGSGSGLRSKRYALQGSRWKVKALSYRMSSYPRKLNQREVDKTIQAAFDVWTKYTDLTFRPVKTNPHIDIRFVSGEHGDGDPFDGPGGTLAHAYFPVYGGDAHFDAAEQWTIDNYRGTNLFQVAAHEFGHSLGLSHSDVRDALMSPFYRGYDPTFSLHDDDILGIQALYGKKTKPGGGGGGGSGGPGGGGGDDDDDDDDDTDPGESGFPGTSDSGADSPLCKDPTFDTIFTGKSNDMYVFKGGDYYHLKDDKVMNAKPMRIKDRWPGLESDIDAAFTYKNGKTYFFKGSKYWRYVDRKMDGQYPKPISEGFTGIPDNIDAATVWSGNGKIYFYKGTKFWRFDPTQKPPVKSTYPKPLSNWEGVPSGINAALKDFNGYTYFFKDGAYYRFNDQAFAVDIVDPAFPRSTANWWFGCKSAPRGTIGTSGSRGFLEKGSDAFDVADDSSFNDAGLHQDGDFETNAEGRKDDKDAAPSLRSASTIVLLVLLLVAIR